MGFGFRTYLEQCIEGDAAKTSVGDVHAPELCQWCDQTYEQHRTSGPAAKMPCGGFRSNFSPAKPRKHAPPSHVAVEDDHKRVADLATSVERNATVKRLRDRAEHWRGVPLFGYAVRVLLEEAEAIEQGRHVP
jgi:hypothetical protein